MTHGPPPKRDRRRTIRIAVVAVLVLAGGVAGYLLAKGDDPVAGTPAGTGTEPSPTDDAASLRAAATKYADAVTGADEATARDMMCDSSTPGILFEENAGKGAVRAGDAELISDTTGVVSITLADSTTLTVPLAFEFTDGAWCVQF